MTEVTTDSPDNTPVPTSLQNAQEAAYWVIDGIDQDPELVFNLYIYRIGDTTIDAPINQTRATEELEEVCKTLRIIVDEGADLEKVKPFYKRLLTIGKGTFANQQFSPQALNQLNNFKEELVRKIGPDIKSFYVKKAIFSALKMIAVVSAITAIAFITISFLEKNNLVFLTSDELYDIPSIARWETGYSIVHTGVLVAFAIVGSLLALIIRANSLSYENLAVPPEDLTKPWLKFLTYSLGALFLSLLFNYKVVSFALGETLSTTRVNDSFGVACFYGLAIGIAEKGAINEVIKWSKEIMRKAGPNQN